MISEGIQSEDLSKIRRNSADEKTSGVSKENKLSVLYGNKYKIPIDHDILKDHGVFILRALSGELVLNSDSLPLQVLKRELILQSLVTN